MRVLFFNYEYPPLGGGAANATAYILREFAKIPDLEVDLVTSSVNEEFHFEDLAEKIHVHRLPIGKNLDNIHFQSQKDLLVYAWKAYSYSKNLIKQNKYDLSHSFFTVPCGFLSMLLKRQYKIPFIVSLRGADVPGYSDRFALLYKPLKPVIRMIWNSADKVVANSDGLKELALKSWSKREISVIHNGISVTEFYPNRTKRSEHAFVITPGASRLTHRKGLNYLLEAVAKLAPKYPQIKVKIMGDGNARTELEKQAKNLKIADKIEFLGPISHDKVLEYYQEANLFVLPSLNEGMSNAMLEALASGLPILATDTGGSKELIEDGVNGFLLKMKDADDIADRIERLIQDKELLERMSQESRQIAERMSWENVAMHYFDIYQKVLNK